ncbi:alpha-protein kinase 1 isoform X4 [Eleutherodactylus coqui]|uniref:alpha-protein kinase 1 isoform X4 n=1 Tax=Eleutherodactylus coqui TaxID=57060 RepID=UPI0034632563
MNNQEVVAVLQECKKMLQVLASEVSEPSEEEKNDYQQCEASLPDDLRSLIQEAKEMKWPFVPERWQYKQAVDPEDKTNLQDLINPRLRNLLVFLKASILVHDSCTAAAIVFLIDRFLYWADASIRLLSVAKVLHKIWPSTPIAPQVVIRQARISVNSGKLLKAEYILSSLISNNGATGTWNYSEESDRLLVQSVCIQIRGQILQKLGMWYEAAELIWTSIVGFFELPIPDKKGLASSLGILADIFISMSEEDYHRFKKSSHVGLTLLEDYEHRLLSAAEACKLAATFSLYTPLFVLTNLNIRGACLLSYSLSKECPTEKRTYYLSQAKESFRIGLLTKKRGDRVISKQELHSFVKAAFCLVNVHKWLNGKQPVNEDVNQLCREAMEKLAKYNMLPDKLDKVNVSIDIMSLVSSIKEHLDVQPFQKTEDNCYVPDSYNDCVKKDLFTRKVRFTALLDMYSQHHNSVCEVFDATCRQHIATDGLKSGACITALKTSDTISTMDDPSSHTDERNCRADEKSVRRRKLVRSDAISFHNSKEELSNSLNSSHRLSSSNSSFSWEYIYKELAKEEVSSNAENTGSIRTSGNHVERVSSNDKSIEVNIQGLSVQENKIPDKKTEELFSGDLGVPGPKTEINSKSSKATSIKHLVPAVSHNAGTDQSSDDEDFEFVDHFSETKSLSNIGKSYSVAEEPCVSRTCCIKEKMPNMTDLTTATIDTADDLCIGIDKRSSIANGRQTVMDGIDIEAETEGTTDNVLPGICKNRLESTGPSSGLGGHPLVQGIDVKAETEDGTDNVITRMHPSSCYTGQAVIHGTDIKSETDALLLKFSKKSELWTAQETVVYIGDDVDVEKEGKQRKAFWIHFLHQDETLGRYVGKSYKKQKELLYHFCDVERQMTAQHYVTEFNKKLHGLNIPTQIFFVPSAVLLIMEGRSIKECVSVEPYILGEFVKLTNNTRAVKTQYEATKYGLAFGHFVYEYFSDIVVDLQGWVTGSEKGEAIIYLTDPQIHSVNNTPGATHINFGKNGIYMFFTYQHDECNEICRKLSLTRPNSKLLSDFSKSGKNKNN